jgi:hypothetical protein
LIAGLEEREAQNRGADRADTETAVGDQWLNLGSNVDFIF